MRLVWLLLLLAVPAAAGCTMCCSDDDYSYSAYGGLWQRGDMNHGRVGSAFAGELSGSPIETPLPAPLEPLPE